MGNTYVTHSSTLLHGAHYFQVVFGKVLEGMDIVRLIG